MSDTISDSPDAPRNGKAFEPRAAAIPRTTEVLAAGSIFTRLLAGVWALNQTIDDAEREYGPKLYEAMMNDPAVGSCVDVIRQGSVRCPTLKPPAELRTRPGMDPTPDEARAAEIAARCNRALHNPKRPLVETLNEFAYGLVQDKLAEIVLDKVAEGPDRGLFTLGAFKFKPKESWRYVVDPHGNVSFVAGVLPVGTPAPDHNDAVSVPGTGANAVLLETDRFAVFAWGVRDSDPRGKPITRRAFNAWNLKTRTWPEKLKGDVQFGTPSVAGIMPEAMDEPDPDEVDGLTNPDGSPATTSEDLFMLAGTRLANGTFSAFPHGTILQVIESDRTGSSLNESIDLYDRQIAMAILHAPQTTMEAEHASKASSESSGDVTQLLINLVRAMLCGMIRNVLRNLIRLNDGPDAAARMVPEVSMGESTDQDLPKLVSAFAAWVTSGAPTPGQLAELDAKIGVSPRRPGDPSIADLAADRAEAASSSAPAGADEGDEDDEDDKPQPKKGRKR